jgi:DDE_Tnp_1-associated
MTRAEKREIKRKLNKEIVEFLKIQNHYFPDLIEDIKKVMDSRHQSYITYEIEVILYMMILKNVCSIVSMQEMNESFNEDECVKNIYKILGLQEKDYLPHYVTVNECLSKLGTDELEKIRKNMVYNLIRKKSFDGAKFLGKYWLVIVDATQLFCFKERHCENCLKKTFNKGKMNEKTIYYHQVLEAKIVFGDDLIISIATEFIENENEEVKKQDCERTSFKRLAASLKNMFPRLPICLMGDSLYACEPVFEICKNNKWEFLIRYKDGSIPTLAVEYQEIKGMNENEEEIVEIEKIYKRKPNVKSVHKMKWVNDLDYSGHKVTVMELEIDKDEKKWKDFQWVTSLRITGGTAYEFSETGRKRWLIENEGFNIQKNIRYFITHANSLDYNAMKNHYLLTQLADTLLQLYECGIKDLKIIKRTLSKISEGLLECLKKQTLEVEDLIFERMQIRKDAS